MKLNMNIEKHLFLPRLVLLVAILLACTFASSAARDANLEKLATANNIFALNLHKALSTDGNKNVFFSPLSLTTVLSMLYYGTRGESAKEFRRTLGYSDANLPEESIHYSFHQLLKMISNSSSKGFELDSANSILVDNHLHLLPEYKKSVQDLYMSSVRSVDFGTNSQQIKESVNKWVEEKTRGMIKELLKDVDPRTLMIMLNAVYFKGKWKDAFKESETRKDNFYNRGLDSPKKVDMMIKKFSRFSYHEDHHYKAIELPYLSGTDLPDEGDQLYNNNHNSRSRFSSYNDWDHQALKQPSEGEQLSMLVILPSSKNGLPSLEQNLTTSKLQDIRKRMWSEEIDLLKLPKFKLEFEKDLVQKLRNLGLKGIFKKGSDDFSGMMNVSDSRRLSVTGVVHKCELEVSEEGTRAAAATAIMAVGFSGGRRRYVFMADHPFLFFIMEKVTGLILFMGRVSEL